MEVREMENLKIYACEWKGERGANLWTGWVTKEEAEAKFKKLGESTPASVTEKQGSGGIFNFRKTIVNNAQEKLRFGESNLKNAKKDLIRATKRVELIKQHIKEYKTEITTWEKQTKGVINS